MRSFDQSKRCCFQHERAINAFEWAFSEAAGAAAAMNLGGECNPASCTVGLTEIGAAVAAAPRGECNPASCTVGLTEIGAAVMAAPHDSVVFGTTPRDSSSNLGDGECPPVLLALACLNLVLPSRQPPMIVLQSQHPPVTAQ